jgi:hypothetical protein
MLGIEGGPRLLLFAFVCIMTWITDRPPTERDADSDLQVWVRERPECGGLRTLVTWTYVHPGVPWQHTGYHQPPAEPASTEPDRIAALEQRVTGLLRAQDELIAAMANRLKALEGVPPEEISYEQAKVEHLRALTTLTYARARSIFVGIGVEPRS